MRQFVPKVIMNRKQKRIKMLQYNPGNASKLIFYSGAAEEGCAEAVQYGLTESPYWGKYEYSFIIDGFQDAFTTLKSKTKKWYKDV